MSMLPGFALPEDLLCVSQDAEAGLPIDAITCALDRADSVLMLLEDHLDGDKPPAFQPRAVVCYLGRTRHIGLDQNTHHVR